MGIQIRHATVLNPYKVSKRISEWVTSLLVKERADGDYLVISTEDGRGISKERG